MSAAAGPDVIENGLVLCLDAGNRESYPGSGTTWTSLGTSVSGGTLVNGPTFSSANGGSIVFDGTNNYIETNYTPSNNNYTISVFFKYNLFSNISWNRGIFSTFSTSNFNGLYFADMGTQSSSTSNMWFWVDGNSRYDIPYFFYTQIWYYGTFVVTSNQISFYLNNNLIQQVTNTTTHKNTLNIGRSRFNQNYLNGNISQVLLYNRALTQAEVLQNYNATKGRFLL